jgi:hypothetical protein
MTYFARMKRDLSQRLFPARDRHAIPSMDGSLSPNDLLDTATPLGEPLPGADDMCVAPDGALLISAGQALYRASGANYGVREALHEFDSPVGAVALHPDGRLFACVAGEGLWTVGGDGGRGLLSEVGGVPLRGLTALAIAPDGSIFATLGSRQFLPADFIHDLMRKNSCGCVVAISTDLRQARILADGLAFPTGVCVAASGREIWFTQAWTHSLHALPIDGGATRTVIPNLPGYPGRITRSADGYALCHFAMRTHLTELVLREDEFRRDMIAYIDPAYWVGPALTKTNSCYEPLQSGNVKKLGVSKPWAPPRSYGLVIDLDETGEPRRSMHSRVGGRWHGVTAAIAAADEALVLSKGAGQLLRSRWESAQ